MSPSWSGVLVVALAAMAPAGLGTAPGAARNEASIMLRNAAGGEAGWVRFVPNGPNLLVRLEARGLTRGTHGVHIHAVGRCDPPDFATAGEHWNPTGRRHGKYHPQGQHLGDLPNLIVESSGRGTLIATLRSTSIAALADADGSAIVVTSRPDDYRTDPNGDSGTRLICGILRR